VAAKRLGAFLMQKIGKRGNGIMVDGDYGSTQEQKTAAIVAQAATATAKAVFEAANAAALVIAKEKSDSQLAMGLLQQDVEAIKKAQSSFESEINRRVDCLDPKFDKIYAKLEEIALGRPTWAILMIITSLFSLSVGLIVYVASHM